MGAESQQGEGERPTESKKAAKKEAKKAEKAAKKAEHKANVTGNNPEIQEGTQASYTFNLDKENCSIKKIYFR